MAETRKKITEQQTLEAFALFTLATQAYAQVREYERGIARAVGHDGEFVDHLSDAIYGEEGSGVHVFAEKLEHAGYIGKLPDKGPKTKKRKNSR